MVEQEEARKETEWKKKKEESEWESQSDRRVPYGEGEKFFSLLDKSVSKFCLN